MTLGELVEQHGYGIIVKKTTNKNIEPVRVLRLHAEGVFLLQGKQTEQKYTERADVEGYEKLLITSEKLAKTVA